MIQIKQILIVFLLLLIIFIAGCAQNTQDTKKDKANAEAGTATPTKWLGYIASGKPYECDVNLTQGDYLLKMKVYLKGKSIREEMTIEGSPVKTIFKNNKTYSLNEVNPDLRDETLKDCDWIIYSTGETTEEITSEQFYDISTFEEIGLAKYICKEASFGDEKFDTTGKVCDVSKLVKENTE